MVANRLRENLQKSTPVTGASWRSYTKLTALGYNLVSSGLELNTQFAVTSFCRVSIAYFSARERTWCLPEEEAFERSSMPSVRHLRPSVGNFEVLRSGRTERMTLPLSVPIIIVFASSFIEVSARPPSILDLKRMMNPRRRCRSFPSQWSSLPSVLKEYS